MTWCAESEIRKVETFVGVDTDLTTCWGSTSRYRLAIVSPDAAQAKWARRRPSDVQRARRDSNSQPSDP